jgi:nucleoside-diphosphate-sugar epimerase
VDGVEVIYHLAGGTDAKSFEAADREAVSPMKNLLDAVMHCGKPVRFVHVSSFSVYSNLALRAGSLLDETCPVENDPKVRGEPYAYAKIAQEQLLKRYSPIPYVIVRPGAIYGPGNADISGRVGMWKAGLFLHLGDSNLLPLTYVSNCADAIVLAGVRGGTEGEAFNIVDDQLVTSKEFLRMYRRHVGNMRCIEVPKALSYCLFTGIGMAASLLHRREACKYNRKRWSAHWKGNTYSNVKARRLLQWAPQVSTEEGLQRYFAFVKKALAENA